MKRLVLSTLLLILGTSNGIAQTIDTVFKSTIKEIMALPVVEKEEETVTTASKKAESSIAAPASMTVITAKEIEAFGALKLHDVLDRVTSMYAWGFNAYPEGLTSMRGINGTHAQQTLVLLNGRPLREPHDNGGYNILLNVFPVHAIAQVEIIRGSGSVLYGSNAYACVINIITKEPEEKLQVSSSLRYGSFQTWQSNLSISKKIKDFSISFHGTYLQTAGWNMVWRTESESSTVNGKPSFKLPVSKLQKQDNYSSVLKLGYKGFSFQYLYAQAAFDGYPQAPTSAPIFFNDTWQPEHYLDLGYKNTWGKFSLNVNTSYSSTYRLFSARGTPNPDYYKGTGTSYLTELYAQYAFSTKLHLSVGGTWNSLYSKLNVPNRTPAGLAFPWQTQYNPTGFNAIDNTENWYSGYFKAEYQVARFLKADIGGQFNQAGFSKLNFVPRINLVANLNEKLYAKFIYGQAFRAPSLFERYLNTTTIDSKFAPAVAGGGSSLNPETITTTEFQLAYKHNTLQVTLTYFNSHQQSIISQSSPSDSLLQSTVPPIVKLAVPKFINKGELASQGIEFESKLTVLKKIYLSASASVFGIDEVKGSGSPNSMVKVGLVYEIRKTGLQVGAFNSYYGAGNSINAKYTANPDASAYNYMTLNFSWDIKKLYTGRKPDVMLILYIDNVFDEAVYYPEFSRRVINTFPGRGGRAFYVSMKVGF